MSYEVPQSFAGTAYNMLFRGIDMYSCTHLYTVNVVIFAGGKYRENLSHT